MTKKDKLNINDAQERLIDLYGSRDYNNTLLANELLLQYVPKAKKLVPSKSVCRKVHGTKKRQNVVFELMVMLEAAGLHLRNTFVLAYGFFQSNYFFCNKKSELTFPGDLDGFQSYNDIDPEVLHDAFESVRHIYE